jgi:alpha-mannosidase
LKLIDPTAPNSEKNTIETLAGPSNVLGIFEDFTGGEPAWNYDPDYWKKPLPKENISVSPIKLIEQGPVRWTLAFDTAVTSEDNGKAIFSQKISMYGDAEGIDCETIVDWNMQWTSTKTYFNIAGKPLESIAEVAYGTIRRGLYPTANHDKPRWENNMQTFVTIPAQDGKFCFNILNTGKYGFDNIKGNIIGISMIRGPHYPDTNKESWANEERATREKAGKGTVPEYIDSGMHRIQLRLIPRKGVWEQQQIEIDAHAWNCPPLTNFISYYPISRESLISTTSGIEATNLKIREEPHELLENWTKPEGRIKATSWILRVYETQGHEHKGSITLSPRMGIKSAQAMDLTEMPVDDSYELEKDADGNISKITARWTPHEIKSILLFRTVYYNQHDHMKPE